MSIKNRNHDDSTHSFVFMRHLCTALSCMRVYRHHIKLEKCVNTSKVPLRMTHSHIHTHRHTHTHVSGFHGKAQTSPATVTCGSRPPVQIRLKTNQGVLCDNETIYIQVVPKMKSHGSTRISCNNAAYKLEENQRYKCTEDKLFVEVMKDMVYKSGGAKVTTKALLVFLLGMSALVF